MQSNKKLWALRAKAPPAIASILAEALSDDTVAISLLCPPRKPMAHIEWLYDHLPNMASLNAKLSVLAMLHNMKPPSLHLHEIPPTDWLQQVSENFPPITLGPWTIHGIQHRHKVPHRGRALEIDASSAFGTGEHPTTRGCLLRLHDLLKRQKKLRSLLDMGCGSGILAMAFTKATHQKAVAIDLDLLAVQIARLNCRANGLQRNITVAQSRGYRSRLVKKRAPYDLIMSNIFAVPLAHMAKDLKCHLRPGGFAILAGLLTSQTNKVLNAHRAQGVYLVKRIVLGEWSILVLHHTKRDNKS